MDAKERRENETISEFERFNILFFFLDSNFIVKYLNLQGKLTGDLNFMLFLGQMIQYLDRGQRSVLFTHIDNEITVMNQI